MIGLDQAILEFIGLIQHLAVQRMLYVEEMAHEVVRTRVWIGASYEIFDLFFGIRMPTMRCFDQYAFETLRHVVTYLGKEPYKYLK